MFKEGDVVKVIDPKHMYYGYIGEVKDENYDNFCEVIVSNSYSEKVIYVKPWKLKLYGTKAEPVVDTSKEDTKESNHKIVSDGGPAGYYDFPKEWNTFNDFIEHKSVNQWKGYSFHLGNIGKAICRWGDKEGTTQEYDAKKIIYSATRVLKMIVGIRKTREYLQTLLDDPQFKE